MKRILFLVALAHRAVALPHDPAVSRGHVAFVEAGQLWVVPRGGGVAQRVDGAAGNISSPRFSPDGKTIAYTSRSIYTIPIGGGTPTRVTWLPSEQLLTQWTSDDRLLFSTNALSFSRIEMQLFTVNRRGGLPQQLPLAFGADGAIDATGRWLAFTPQWPNPLIANWKRYRGGAAREIRVVDLWSQDTPSRDASRLPSPASGRGRAEGPGEGLRPMWRGTTLYYVSDTGDEQRANIWSYDTTTHVRRQVTHFREYDVHNASIGPDAIVFELGPDIQLVDLRSGKSSPLRATIPETPLQRDVDASRFVTFTQTVRDTTLIEARGDLWIATGNMAPRNITTTSGAFEREAALRPDGGAVAYWSDETGEYQLYIRAFDEKSTPVTSYTSGFRYRPVWSPDGRRLAFVEQTGAIVLCDVAERRLTEIDREPWNAGIEPTELAWSADSTWLAYTRTAPNRLNAIWRYDVATGTRQQLTSDAFNAATPLFDASGEHFFFLSDRNFGNPASDWIQSRIVSRGLGTIIDVPLRGTAFDIASFERHATRLPATTGSITSLALTPEGNLRYGLTDLGGKSSVRIYDLRAQRDSVAEEAPKPATDMSSMKMRVDLRAEWRELFDDAWRLYRDFFFAPKTPLAGWPRVKVRYGAMLDRCRTREEVNLVLAQMIGESSVGHAYITNGGDVTPSPSSDAATLGADFIAGNGAIRISRIIEAAPWDDTMRSPLRAAREGETILAINDKPLDGSQDPRAAIAGLAGQEVRIKLGPESRVITVTPLASENELRRRAWIERNRRRVDEASAGRIGYIHIPDFTTNGYGDLMRQYTGQIAKDALIIDARWSLGGSTGGTVAELFARRLLNSVASRYSKEAWPAPRYGAHFGAKALLVNHITVSAGENFSSYFRKLGLGPIIGARTWGGLTGLNPVPSLIDGGAVNVPNAPFFDETGWLIEGHGLEPDVAVERDPASESDAQLEAAIKALASRLDYSSRPLD